MDRGTLGEQRPGVGRQADPRGLNEVKAFNNMHGSALQGGAPSA